MAETKRLSALLERGVAAWKQAEQNRWLTAEAAAACSGLPGATVNYSRRLAVTPQMVRRLAGAWIGWLTFEKLYDEHPVLKAIANGPKWVRSKLGTEYFTEWMTCIRKYEPDGQLAEAEFYLYLSDAAAMVNSGDQMSSKHMRQLIEGANKANEPPDWWKRVNRIVNELGKLQGDYGIPEDLRKASRAYYNGLTRRMKRGVVK